MSADLLAHAIAYVLVATDSSVSRSEALLAAQSAIASVALDMLHDHSSVTVRRMIANAAQHWPRTRLVRLANDILVS